MRHVPSIVCLALPLLVLAACSHKNAPAPAPKNPATAPYAAFLPADSPDTQALLDNLDKTHVNLLNLTGMRLDMAVLLLNTRYPQKISADWATLQFAGLPPSAPVTLHAENLSERQLLDQIFNTISSQHPPLKLSSQAGALRITFLPPPRPDPSTP